MQQNNSLSLLIVNKQKWHIFNFLTKITAYLRCESLQKSLSHKQMKSIIQNKLNCIVHIVQT